MTRLSRRNMLKLSATAALAAGTFAAVARRARAQVEEPVVAARLLFVVCAPGGASITDAFLARKASETPDAANLLVFPDELVHVDEATGLRALDLPDDHRRYMSTRGPGTAYLQSTFLARHGANLAVIATEGSSVTHSVGQERALDGFGICRGRTLLEVAAERHGQALPLPCVNMAAGGFQQLGSDATLDPRFRQTMVHDARLFSLSTDGARGVIGAPSSAPGAAASSAEESARSRALVARARGVREELDASSTFAQTFQCAPLRARYVRERARVADIEARALINRLGVLGDDELGQVFGGAAQPLSAFGLAPHPDVAAVRAAFDPSGDAVLSDPFLAEAVLAFLLARHGVSCAVSFGPQVGPELANVDVNPPLSFDHGHTNHVASQAVMWSRVLDVVDKLVTLLKATQLGNGETMWDRSTVYIATDFGRDKHRSTGQDLRSNIPTGHHVNNGSVILSPRIVPGLHGGLDPATLLTYGVDRATGLASSAEKLNEGDLFSAVCHCIDAPFAGRIEMPWLMSSSQ